MQLDNVPRAQLERLARAKLELRRREERAFYEGSLRDFVAASWPYFDGSAEYQQSWALDALCDHLTAVTYGHIKRLLINFPPRGGKSSVASIAWPAWTWTQQDRSYVSGPQVQFLCASYGHTLSLKLSNQSRRLLTSPFYQRYWGDRFVLRADQNAKHQYDNSEGGSRIATSVTGGLLGIGGAVLIADDLHNTEQVESEAERETVLRFWREFRSTRLNDPKQSAIVAVMQRLHEDDVSGVILEDTEDWTHLMLPMRHDPGRHCVTVLKWDENGEPEVKWEDPRDPDGTELMWPERFGETEVRMMERELGPYMASGRLQQSPQPQGGGIIKREWWQLWEEDTFPEVFAFKWASADTAYTEKEENDPTGFTVWGMFEHQGHMKIMLMHAWRKRLELHVPMSWTETDSTEDQRFKRVMAWQKMAANMHQAKAAREHVIDPGADPWFSYIKTGLNGSERWGVNEPHEVWKQRTQGQWGLCEWIADTCRRFGVSKVLVEGKASGLSVAQELQRLHSGEGWGVEVRPVQGDKVARLYAVQSLFSSGLIYAPDREWAQMAIDEISAFPKGRYKDLTDSTSQALEYVRSMGIFERPEQRAFLAEQMAKYKSPSESRPLYPGST